MLGKAAGLKLEHDIEFGEVTVGEELAPEGTSQSVRAALERMIGDPTHHAKVEVDSPLIFGKFGDWQQLNVANAVTVEKGAPGAGVAIAIHEIWENYSSRAEPAIDKRKYGPAHGSAIGVEREAATELSGLPGGRVAAAFSAPTYALDYETYFVVLTLGRRHSQKVEAARRVGRTSVGSFTLEGFPVGESVSRDTAGGLVTDALGCLEREPMATARVTGLRTADENRPLSKQRADAVRKAIVVARDEDDYREGKLAEVASKGEGADLGARRAWSRNEEEVGEVRGVRIDIHRPTLDG